LVDFHQLKYIDFLKYLKKIKSYSERFDYECCGIASTEKFHILKNISETKQENFLIAPKDYYDIIKNARIHFIWHSHVLGDERPSEIDIEYSSYFMYPSIIYSTISKKFSIFHYDSNSLVYFTI